MKRLRIATRKSALALWQANFIKDELERVHAGLTVELVPMTTKGDRWLSAPLREVGGKGLFIKELELAMLEDRADAAVHSMKDLPAELPEAFCLAAVAYREDVRDVLVGVDDIQALQAGARIGSSSLRRQSQLLHQRPDWVVQPIRGNVDTRLDKLNQGEFDAIVLAAAGLKRLGLAPPNQRTMSVEQSLPAAGQGALGIECLAAADEVRELIGALNDATVARCVGAERLVSAGLGADCSMPLAAYAQPDGDEAVRLLARLGTPDGARMLNAEAVGNPGDAAATVVAALVAQGADELLAEVAGQLSGS